MYQVDNFNYTEWCNELMILITIDNSVELMTLLCLTILTQLVNYALVPHNTETVSHKLKDQILHKNLFCILKLSVFQIKRVN